MKDETTSPMYLEHFGLRRKPFSLTFDPHCYYPAAHQEATNDLCYSIEEHQGLATLVGEPGTGKSTLLNSLLRTFDSNLRGVLVSDASLATGSLLKQLMVELGLPLTDAQMLPTVLRGYIQNWVQLGKSFVLLVDEAQSLSDHQLEELRFLTNLELQGRKLVEIILAGQPSLETRLASPQFEALRQRIAVRSYLRPLSLEHTAVYVQWRMEAAGARDARIFSPGAIEAAHRRSRGLPRLVNLLCDRALLTAYADNARVVEAAAVELAANELGIDEGSSTSSGVTGRPGFREPAETPDNERFGELEKRLVDIERKLDAVLDILLRAEHPNSGDDPTAGGPAEPEPAPGEGRVTSFPRFRRGAPS
jgi:general secretion pathway protein A